MNFNLAVRNILEPILELHGFTLINESAGAVQYENSNLAITISYDFRASYEVNFTITFKATNEFYTYSEIMQLFNKKQSRYPELQIVKGEILNLWIEELSLFLKENLTQIINNNIEIALNLLTIREKNVKEYSKQLEDRFLREEIDKFWRTKEYARLVELLNKHEGRISGSIMKKYEYALKNI